MNSKMLSETCPQQGLHTVLRLIDFVNFQSCVPMNNKWGNFQKTNFMSLSSTS